MFFSHVLYLPTEAGEEDLAVLVFVLQLLGHTDEAGAGLRAVSHLQKREASVITRSQLMPPATAQRRMGMYLVASRKTLGDLFQPPPGLFIALIP